MRCARFSGPAPSISILVRNSISISLFDDGDVLPKLYREWKVRRARWIMEGGVAHDPHPVVVHVTPSLLPIVSMVVPFW